MTIENKKDINKRIFLRIPKEAKILYQKLEYSLKKKKIHETTMKNIGGGGILFETDEELEHGTLLQLDIFLKDWQRYHQGFLKMHEHFSSRPITAVAEVVRSQKAHLKGKYDTGVKFINIYEDDLKALLKFLEEADHQS